MDALTLTLLISGLTVVFLVFLFSVESKRGTRFGESVRVHADFWVIKVSHACSIVVSVFRRDFLRQVFHYIFHTFLKWVLVKVRNTEDRVKSAMRTNKILARNAERESAVRTKLEEVALHKASITLSDEEKQKVKDKMLHGE